MLQDTAPDNDVLTVSRLSQAIRQTMEGAFPYVQVKGELSGVKRAASGHIYFDLKDSQDVIAGVCWRGTAQSLAMQPQEGLEVVCTGKVTTYRSRYQLVVSSISVAGEGALLALLEKRKKQLMAEGLFDADRKKPLPFLPESIAIVTSESGAVLHDICHRIRERCPRNVYLASCPVQGQDAAPKIVAALKAAIAQQPDVIIMARGGGSVEDLWCFNEEIVVRAVADCPIPIITAIGHETDTTLVDLAADLRAPTPTGAAERAVPVRQDLLYTLQEKTLYLQRLMQENLATRKQNVQHLGQRLASPQQKIMNYQQRLDEWSERLPILIDQQFKQTNLKLEALSRVLESNSHKKVLQQGYVDGEIRQYVYYFKTTDKRSMQLHFYDGVQEVVVSNFHLIKFYQGFS